MSIKSLEIKLLLNKGELGDLMALFLDTCQADINRLKPAIKTGDPEQVRSASHSIKGSALVFGFSELCHAARELEMMALRGELGEAGKLLNTIEDLLLKISIQSESP